VGPASDHARITRVVHPQHTATPFHYRVDDEWLTQFWIGLSGTNESVRVQVHTHRGLAGHSLADNEGAIVYQPGFLSLVIPGFAMKDNCRQGAFLAELGESGKWLKRRVAELLSWQ
jgi:hypothetical protein